MVAVVGIERSCAPTKGASTAHGFQKLGYDTLPIDSMQGLEIGGGGSGGPQNGGGPQQQQQQQNGGGPIGPPPSGQPTSPYAMDMDVGEMDASELTFDHLDVMPSPPQDNNQVAAWYDTDL